MADNPRLQKARIWRDSYARLIAREVEQGVTVTESRVRAFRHHDAEVKELEKGLAAEETRA